MNFYLWKHTGNAFGINNESTVTGVYKSLAAAKKAASKEFPRGTLYSVQRGGEFIYNGRAGR